MNKITSENEKLVMCNIINNKLKYRIGNIFWKRIILRILSGRTWTDTLSRKNICKQYYNMYCDISNDLERVKQKLSLKEREVSSLKESLSFSDSKRSTAYIIFLENGNPWRIFSNKKVADYFIKTFLDKNDKDYQINLTIKKIEYVVADKFNPL